MEPEEQTRTTMTITEEQEIIHITSAWHASLKVPYCMLLTVHKLANDVALVTVVKSILR